jgi:rubredoxin
VINKSFSQQEIGNMGNTDFKKYECVICGFIYDEAEGLPEDGIPPGTRWADIPEDWECPDCGISKSEFDLYVE